MDGLVSQQHKADGRRDNNGLTEVDCGFCRGRVLGSIRGAAVPSVSGVSIIARLCGMRCDHGLA